MKGRGWREKDPLHGKTHIHMQEHVSTQRNVSWTHGKTNSQAAQGCTDLLPSPRQGICISHLWKARPTQENMLHLTCAMRDKHALLGHRRVWGRAEGAVISLTTSQAPPCVFWWARVTVHEHTTSRVSKRWGGEEVGEGMREQDSGVQIPAEIL